MHRKLALLVLALSLSACTAVAAATDDRAIGSCPVTQPPNLPFVPPAPYPIEPPNGTFWFGTASFWTMLEHDARWGVAKQNHISQKVFWWRPGFNGALENYPDLTVTLRRLDRRSAPIIATRKATNASDESFGGSVMLTGISIPAAGCWQVTGHHRGSEVTFVVQVSP